MKYKVTKKAMRPVSNVEGCFYCGSSIGSYHKDSCVLVSKRVKVKATIEYEIEVPNSWSKKDVEFHRNEGSWCASNMLGEMKKLEEKEGCLCQFTKFEYIGDTSKSFLDED